MRMFSLLLLVLLLSGPTALATNWSNASILACTILRRNDSTLWSRSAGVSVGMSMAHNCVSDGRLIGAAGAFGV
jgi:hypothetical protein